MITDMRSATGRPVAGRRAAAGGGEGCCPQSTQGPLVSVGGLQPGGAVWFGSGVGAVGGLRCKAACMATVASPGRVAAMRRFAAAALASWQVPAAVVDSAVLVVGELAANAAEHGGMKMGVGLRLAGTDLSIEIADWGKGSGAGACTARSEGEHGRGLDIVRAVADRFDAVRTADGTVAVAQLRAVAA